MLLQKNDISNKKTPTPKTIKTNPTRKNAHTKNNKDIFHEKNLRKYLSLFFLSPVKFNI